MSSKKYNVGDVVIIQNVGFTFDSFEAEIIEKVVQHNGFYKIRLENDLCIYVNEHNNEIRSKLE